MKILVLVKVINGEINPFDESALECGLCCGGEVTVVTMGPKGNAEILKPLTRLGANVILISDNIFAGSDTLATSYILSTAIKAIDYDLILAGRQSVDGDTAQVGPMVSKMLGINLITNAMSVKILGDKVIATTRAGAENTSLPALVTVEREYVLRFPSIFSKQGEVTVIDNSDIGCDKEKCGLHGSPTRVIETFENEKGKRKCKFISFDELPALLNELNNKDKHKNIDKPKVSKLKSIWAVGEEVLEKGYEIADEVVLVEKTTPEEISERVKKELPDVILWNADLWGRKNAPVTAAILGTGLCADCTELQTDGENFYMYRPARGGSVYAKIKCLTKPQMATVRTKQPSSDIIVSGGKGVSENIEKLKSFAEKFGAELCASRGLVDMGKVPYEMQVGLTGKTVSPKIYIAVGISGAVHHTCAIDGADTVIAINPDKDARIFEYADYGIIEEF